MSRATLPRWQCHKRVTAARIERMESRHDGGATLYFAGGLSVPVTFGYVERCRPEVGGYWVRYDHDDYESYSPAASFEDGYTLLPLA
jgi:hypothetical protein